MLFKGNNVRAMHISYTLLIVICIYLVYLVLSRREDPVGQPNGEKSTKKYARMKVRFRGYISQISFKYEYALNSI